MLYNSLVLAQNINTRLKQLKLSQKDMLISCELNKNTISTLISRGSFIKSDSLAKIADYLDCSVDYLLGRTDNPDVNE